MRIAIMGTGGVGGYFGGRLAAAGEDVSFIARGTHRDALTANGLILKSVRGDAHINPVRVTDDPASIGSVDILLMCVKGWDTRSAAQMCRPLIGPETGVISLQNGIDHAETMAEVFGAQHVLGGLCFIISYVEAPGVIRHESQVQRIIFGELDGHRTDRAERFLEACQRAKIDAVLSDNILRDTWTKYLFICAMSGMTSLTRQPVGAIMAHDDTRDLMRQTMQEVWEVGRAAGVDLPDGLVEDRIDFAANLEYSSTSSMQRDLEAGRPMEVALLNGTVARLGRKFGVETPVNHMIYACLQFYEHGSRA